MTGSRQNLTRTRVRRTPDFGRIADAVSRPGIDPRTWLCVARVDIDPDATVWDEDLGWLVDVSFVGGALDGEGPVVCRVASAGQGAEAGRFAPPREGGLVLVGVINGDVNDDAVIVGQIAAEGEPVPTSVNGDSIVERDPQSGEVGALETHLAVFPSEDVDQAWRAARITASGELRLHGGTVELGVKDADQPFARGDDLADALGDLADALDTFSQLLTTPAVPPAPPYILIATAVAAYTPLAAAIVQFKTARNGYLSTRIKGD